MQDVFEPTANFGGDVFEPVNFDGENSNFSATIIAKAVGDTMQGAGMIADARARRKEAESKIKELSGRRGAEKDACSKNPSFKKFLDRKYRNNRIKDCQEKVDKRINQDEAEQKAIQREMLEIEKGKIGVERDKIALQSKPKDVKKDTFLGMPKVVGISVTIGVVLILAGLTTFLILKRK